MSAKIIPIQIKTSVNSAQKAKSSEPIAFKRYELSVILNVYGQMVAKGYWKDYAIDFMPQEAVFSIYRRATETPLYQIYKRPNQRTKGGLYCIIAPGGLIIKRGNDLRQVLRIFDKKRFASQ